MWLTCNDALNRYDGKTVKVFNLDKYFDNCPNLQQGYGFAEDDAANIYIGSVRGLYIYNRSRDKFILKKIFNNKTDDIAMPIGFYDGKIWYFNKQYQLATYDVKTKKVTLVSNLNLKPIKSIHIYEMVNNCFYYHYPFIDNNGKIWIVGNNEILKFDTKTNQSHSPLKEFITNKNVTIYSSCFEKTTNTLFIGTGTGLFEYSISKNTINEIKNDKKKLGQILCITAQKEILVFRTNYEVFFLNRKSNLTRKITVNDKNNYNRTFGYSFDKSGRLWICDDGSGQLIFDFHSKLLPKIPDESTNFNYFNLSGITRFVQLTDNEIVLPIIIQQKSMLVFFDMKTKKMRQMPFMNMSSVGTLNYGCTTDLKRKGIWFFSQSKKEKNIILTISFLN
jgi:hypothetical protein